MTGIANLNIVIQQGDTAREAQQLRSSHQASQDVASSMLPDKIMKERTSVQESPDSRKMKWQKDRKNDRKRRFDKKKGARDKNKNKKGSQSDHILDTIV